MVSWWDYGYWITIVGNMTSVNDNATWNATRIGEVGLAMMSTDPRYSAEIFKDMHADYVLVFFGHLYSGLGGDEGKWQWMLRICNDYTQDYLNSGFLDKNLWYGQGTQKVNTVYDEADYINDSSGLYEPAWFQSTVVQMMFDKDPTTLSDVPQNNQVEAYYAAQIAGDAAQNIQQRTLDNGQPWANYIPTDGNYQFTYWQPAFFFSNNLVKIYKMDYNALDAQVNIDNTNLDTNGVGSVNITNTGTIPYNVQSISVTGSQTNNAATTFNYTLQNPDNAIQPNESRYICFNTNRGWSDTDTYSVKVNVGITNQDNSISTVSNTSAANQ